MRRITSYILRSLVGPFLFGSCTVMFLFLLQFLMKYVDKLLGKGLGFWLIAELIALNLAWMVVLSVPMGILVATLMAFGNLSSTNEVTIVKSGGGSLYGMMRPAFVVGIGLFVGLLWFNDRVLPDANHRAKILMSDIQRKKPTFAVEAGQFSQELEGFSILSRQVDTATGDLLNVTLYDNRNANRSTVVTADTGRIRFSADTSMMLVTLRHGQIVQVSKQTPTDSRETRFEKHRMALSAGNYIFRESDQSMFSRGDRELTIADMSVIVDTAQAKVSRATSEYQRAFAEALTYLLHGDTLDTGASLVRETTIYNSASRKVRMLRSTLESQVFTMREQRTKAQKYEVEVQKKYSIPFACVVFVLVGCPLGVITKRGNFGVSAAISLGFYVVYWACLIVGEKFADRGIISPWFGMWMANIVIGVIGIVLTLRTNNENFSVLATFKRLFR